MMYLWIFLFNEVSVLLLKKKKFIEKKKPKLFLKNRRELKRINKHIFFGKEKEKF